ncbi:FK506-binding nuclear protein, partial [Tremellales sp. Uapishka_1]
MSIKMNLWSLTLLPGEKYPLYIRKDFTITNAALGEELVSETGRSVVKVTHSPIPPAAFDSDSDDDEYDSELEDEMADEFSLSSDEEEVEGGEVDVKVNGGDDAEGDDDEEDMDEDDDSDFSDDEVVETVVLCSLTAGKIEQASLNLTFVEGEVVRFEVTGENPVHLVGNYLNQWPESSGDSDDDSDFDEDDYNDLIGSDDDEDLEVDAQIEEIESPAPKAKKALPAVTPVTESKKRKADEVESPAVKVAAAAVETLSKNEKKKLNKKLKAEAGEAAPPPVAAKAEKKVEKKDTKPQKKTLPSGLVIEDMKVGDGPVAKPGKRLGMRYIGKLENGKQFDANTSGKPFTFVLGKGEVISGWDQGLNGMAVGGERRLTIPAPLAYGNQKIPGIPKNSTLKFDVKLVSVN